MAARSLAMSDSFQPPARQTGFLRRLIMLLLFTTGIVFWMGVLHRYQSNISELWMTAFADIAIALAAGLGARITFYNRNWFARFIAAIACLILGLYALGFLTNWRIGIGPIESWRIRIEWSEIIQLAGGFVIVLLSLMAWWRPTMQVEDVEIEPARAVRRESRARAHAPKLPSFRLPKSWTSRSSRNGHLRVRKARANGRAATREVDKVVVSKPLKPARSRRKKASQRKPELQLSVYEDHRCPYCLEDVKRNDPRGVKECSICHTLHHADCWNVTGMCQIPHLNSLNL